MDNKLSVFTFQCRKSYYLTHPWRWFKELYHNIRNFVHRGKYGYAFVDVWDFCEWYPRVGAAALRYLADHASGYPGIPPWDTPEQWHDHLIDMARNLEKCADTLDICYTDDKNEYAEQFHMMSNSLRRHSKDPVTGCYCTFTEESPEFMELRDKYFAREKELEAEYKEFRMNVGAALFDNLARYWD